MNAIRRQLASPAMLVACAALIVALGGVSYAAAVLPRNSVGAAQLKQRAVTGAKLNKDAVTTAKVKNGSLTGADFKAGGLPAGPQGPQGAPGPQGPPGSDAQFNGAAAGGDLTGAFPNPLIANDAVTSPKVAPNSLTAGDLGADSVQGPEVATNSVQGDEIENGSLSAVDVGVSSGSVFANMPSIPPGACASVLVDLAPGAGDLDDNAAIVTPALGFGGLVSFHAEAQGHQLGLKSCNLTGAAQDPDSTGTNYNYVVFG